mmetsp:Transcript_15238/g.65247  ORF Transcript_15238/g.65247 Transcript_15238/m.65247 type:complete len:229 (-) Transcript_15238:253-939(-)
MLSASFSTSRPSLPFSPQPQEYTSPALVSARMWSVPLATAVARPASESGAYRVCGFLQICSPSGVNAYSPEEVRNVPHAMMQPSAVTTAACESPVDKSTAALDPRFTGAGFDSASGSSLFARRPSTPSSFTPQEYTRPPCTMASVCMPPHATFSTGKPAGTTVSSRRGRRSSNTSSPRPSCPPSPVPKTKHLPCFSSAPATSDTAALARSIACETSLNSSLISLACFL